MLCHHPHTHALSVQVLCHCSPHMHGLRGCSATALQGMHRVRGFSATAPTRALSCGFSATAPHTGTEYAGSLLLLPTRALSVYVLHHHPIHACTEYVASLPPAPHTCTERAGAQPCRAAGPILTKRKGSCLSCHRRWPGRGQSPLSCYRKPPRATAPHPDAWVPPAAAGAPRPAGRRRSHFPLAGPNPAPHPGENPGGDGGGAEEEEGEEAPPCPTCNFA